MYQLLIRLMFFYAVLQFGIALSDFADCRSLRCLKTMDRASRAVLNIDWKPISVFPEEARRFQDHRPR